MKVLRIAAFSDGNRGGNPAGVSITEALPSDSEMLRIAAAVGFSETAFAAPAPEGWRVRYFSPEIEVPFCGHATIALGAALARETGDGVFTLALNDASITVEAHRQGAAFMATLQSPPTYSEAVDPTLKEAVLDLFGYEEKDLDPILSVALAHAGANHLIVGLNSRQALSAMRYDFKVGHRIMKEAGLATILLGFAESAQLFHTRNPFASGGVYEDPATGAATAALAGYLRDIGWPHNGLIDVVQGEDMGSRSLLRAEITAEIGSSVRVSGTARFMDGP